MMGMLVSPERLFENGCGVSVAFCPRFLPQIAQYYFRIDQPS